jgi:tetratricopeptide (TPR) repeat protein
MRLILWSLLLSMGIVSAQEKSCPQFQKGVEAYKNSEFASALSLWEACAKTGFRSADLFYNLGNAAYRESKVGLAIWAYESALRLDPTDEDVNANLEMARALTVDRVEKTDEDNPILRALWKLHHLLDMESALWIVFAFFWIAGILLALAWTRRSESARNACFVALFLLSFPFGLLLLDVGFKAYLYESDKRAVVLTAEADIMSGPGDRYQVLHEIHEGTLVQIQDVRGDWANIKVGESVTGFVKNSQIRQIQ